MGIDTKRIEIEGQKVVYLFCKDCLIWIAVDKWRGDFPQHGNTCGECRMTAKYRQPISIKTRFAVLSRDNFTCHYCGKSAPGVVLHIDHIQPVSKGGNNSMVNLVTACSECNLGKSDTVLKNFKKPEMGRPKKMKDR